MHRYGAAWRLSAATTFLTFCLIVIGSVVRATGSGLACPDWPLCEGRIIPRFEYHVLIEWTHRLIAMLVSLGFVVTAAIVLTTRELRARLGGLFALAAALLAAQVVLGALTVWKLLHPAVVSSHLAVALLFFATLVTISLSSWSLAHERRQPAPRFRSAGLLAAVVTVTALTYLQAILGGAVSTSHAGLACPGWPDCGGEWVPAHGTPQGLQMMHRWVAYVLVLAVTWTFVQARRAPHVDVRAGAALALALVVAQVLLGIANVMLALPVWLSALHLATATALLAANVAITWGVLSAAAAERRAEVAA